MIIVSASTNESTAMIRKAVRVLLRPLALREELSSATAAEIHAANSISFIFTHLTYYDNRFLLIIYENKHLQVE